MSAEDEIKVKYTGFIKTMSHIELKSFDKTKYQKLALTELKHMFPNLNETKLRETARCISNALDSEAKSQRRARSRDTATTTKTSNQLSETFIADLETTMQPEATYTSGTDSDVDGDDDCETDDSDEETESENERSVNEAAPSHNDSTTQLKKAATISEDKTKLNTGTQNTSKCWEIVL